MIRPMVVSTFKTRSFSKIPKAYFVPHSACRAQIQTQLFRNHFIGVYIVSCCYAENARHGLYTPTLMRLVRALIKGLTATSPYKHTALLLAYQASWVCLRQCLSIYMCFYARHGFGDVIDSVTPFCGLSES